MPERDPDCLFCAIVAGEQPAEIVFEDEISIAFLDVRPVFHGHSLLVPRDHYETLADLPDELVEPYFRNVRMLSVAIPRAMGAEGSFVAINNVVSQSVPHLHTHVVPRVPQGRPARVLLAAHQVRARRPRLGDGGEGARCGHAADSHRLRLSPS